MNLQDICVDLELAKELKENDWKTMTWFYFKQDYHDMYYSLNMQNISHSLLDIRCEPKKSGGIYSAPTTDELLKVLPKYLNLDNSFSGQSYLEIDNLWEKGKMWDNCNGDNSNFICHVSFNLGLTKDTIPEITDKKLPNALAKMWLYLKKNNLLEDK